VLGGLLRCLVRALTLVGRQVVVLLVGHGACRRRQAEAQSGVLAAPCMHVAVALAGSAGATLLWVAPRRCRCAAWHPAPGWLFSQHRCRDRAQRHRWPGTMQLARHHSTAQLPAAASPPVL
jgi:hypothetical protein